MNNRFLEYLSWIPMKVYSKVCGSYFPGEGNKLVIDLNKIGIDDSFNFYVNDEKEMGSLSSELRCFRIREPNNLKHYVKFIEKEDVLLDVGAHFGFFSVLGKKAKKIIAIEPIKECFYLLNKNLKENNLTDKTKVFNLALGNEKYLKMDQEGSSNLSKVNAKGKIKVKCKDLNYFAENFDTNLLKLDIEGYEYEIFMNQEVPKKINKITMELHICLIGIEKSREIIEKLYKQGFYVKYLIEDMPLRFYPFIQWKWLFNKLTWCKEDLTLKDALRDIEIGRGIKYVYLVRK